MPPWLTALLMTLGPQVLSNLMGGFGPQSDAIEPYVPPTDIPLTDEEMGLIYGQAGQGSFMSPPVLTDVYQNMPAEMRPFLSGHLESQAARNTLNQGYYRNWLDFMDRSYGAAADTLRGAGQIII